jgi:hypothetical protein
MTTMTRAAVAALVCFASTAGAQLGHQHSLVEPNVAADSTLLKLPGMTQPIVDALKDARPILSVVTLDSILGAKGLSKAQRTTLYNNLFVHVDLNRGTDAEFLLIPGVDAAKLRTIKAGRPYKAFSGAAAPIEQYVFIPIELNTFTNEIMDTFAPIGVGTSRWKREFAEYRPWKTMEQFDREIGKYVRSRPAELNRLRRYVIIAP